MQPVRVLHIVGIMDMGGLENLIMNIYRKIDRDKVQFDFLVTRQKEGVFDKEIHSLGGKIYNVDHISEVGYWKYTRTIYNFFKAHPEYKIVHCHRDALCALYLKQAKRAGIEVRIAHSHTIQLAEAKSIKGIMTKTIKTYFKLLTRYNATEYFACSKEAGEWLYGKSIGADKIKVIKNGIDLKKYRYDKKVASEIREELGIEKDTLLIGHVGRFDIAKNHGFLITIFSELEKNSPNYKLCLVGEGKLYDEIKQKVIGLGLEQKVIFLGIRNNVNELMMAFDMFLFPSLFEGLGIVAVEAQATGLRCLVSDKVPKEADMELGLVEYLSIDTVTEWVEKIELINKEVGMQGRKNSNQKIMIEKGYDILTTTQYLQNFYLDKY